MTKEELVFLSLLIEGSDEQNGIFFIEEDRETTMKDFCGVNCYDTLKKGVYIYGTQIENVNFLEHYEPTKVYEILEDVLQKIYYFDIDNIINISEVKAANEAVKNYGVNECYYYYDSFNDIYIIYIKFENENIILGKTQSKNLLRKYINVPCIEKVM
jgi:hypothetical protein